MSLKIPPKHLSSLLTTDLELDASLATKVDKIPGKNLSTEDYTTTEKNKVATIDTKASVDEALIYALIFG